QPNLLDQIVDYAMNLRYEDIPPEAAQIAKWLIFDTIGTGLGGFQRPLGQKAIRYSLMQMPGDEATLLGDGRRCSMEGAAFANGVMVKILGMDDSHRSAGHIASQMIPAVLAVGEAYQTSGPAIITALVAAYDFAVRIGYQVRHSTRERGFDLKGVVGPMSSALAAGLCAGLSADKLRNAVALAMDMSGSTEQYVYEGGPCETKDLIAGFAARNAVFAVKLADADFYGPHGALDGAYGFFRAFGDGFDPNMFADLGQDFAITTTAFKPHGGCRHTHQAIDAVQQILSEGELDTSAITSIDLATYTSATQPSFRVDPNPPSQSVAGLSIRVATAVALTQGSAWPEDYTHWDDPEVQRLRHLINVSVDPELDRGHPDLNGCRLNIMLETGETRSAYLPHMKGEPEFRMTADELREKFYALTRNLFSIKITKVLAQQCDQFEAVTDLSPILRVVSAQPVEVSAD
ncbi:MAG: MmgE/PrpD family protein, partial [Chloroflexi bacterium]|nr:MmgE/PrpD family protein [Chloroflexota bacterium]